MIRQHELEFAKAERVRLSGLSRADLNGSEGEVLQYHEASGRWCVKLDAGESIRVRVAFIHEMAVYCPSCTRQASSRSGTWPSSAWTLPFI